MNEATSETCLAGLEPGGLREALRALGPRQVVCHSDRRLSISASRVRGFLGNEPFVAVSGDEKADEQVKGFTDALYWQVTQAPACRPQYFIGRSEATERVLQALASLNDLLPAEHRVAVHVDGDRPTLRLPVFAGEKPHWLGLLRARDKLLDEGPPLLADKLAKRVDRPDFRWHLSVHATSWSGRLGGLRVCEVKLDGSRGRVAVGKADSKHPAARAFRELAPGPFDLSEDTLDTAVAVVRGLAQHESGLGDPEHRLEDQILRNQIDLLSEVVPFAVELGGGGPVISERLRA